MIKKTAFLLVVLFVAIICLPTPSAFADIHDPQIYTDDIRNFKEADQANPPAPGGILFLGSSSIRLWDLEKFFPGMGALNRGYGGSYISDSIYYADQILLPYRPRTIVFYAGGNDLAAGKPPEQVYEDFRALASIVAENLPETDFIYIAIKPSIARIKLRKEIRQVNGRIEGYCQARTHFFFLDIEAPTLGPDGNPNPDLFREDGLHLNEAGYKVWSDLLRPMLQ